MRSILTTAVLLAGILKICGALELNCTYTTRSYDFIGSVYECDATISAGDIDKLTSVSGTHQAGKAHANIIALRITYQNLQSFPVNVEAFFPNLRVLQLYGNSISEVKNAHLAPFPTLVYLNLYRNKISTISGNLFDGLDSLQYVSFESNDVRHVGHDLALPKDGLIFFDTNPCINVRASTPDQIEALRFNILINCTLIAPIEAALERRQNVLTSVNDRVGNLEARLDLLEQRESQRAGGECY
ncbi:leucine-rich repeat-containing G-protein coupled receptor 4-like [Bradysia coprophila]|uniref:leucine-rich repeat-containing G-protein coupled receptor 4-like n=1 Tax=Bradysia coprophila TaxID=38358 RepID=UPI00187DCAFC|nr:leucine-rich repeat-containing G-protein coupled receptor 4-like [Bradysia coprophila]